MDQDILEAFRDTLMLLMEARCQLEGEVALTTSVNNDLRRCLRRLQIRSHQGNQTLPRRAVDVHQVTQQLAALSAPQQEPQHTRPQQHVDCGRMRGSGRAASSGGSSNGYCTTQSAQRTPSASTLAGCNKLAAGSTRITSVAGQGAQCTVWKQTVSSSSTKGSRNIATAGGSTRRQGMSNGLVSSSSMTATPTIAAGVLNDLQQPHDMLELPSSFKQLFHQYNTLQEHVQDATCELQQHQGITPAAAAGFLSALDRAYRGNTAATIQQTKPRATATSARQLSFYDFGQQANYIGLLSATLWAVQMLHKVHNVPVKSLDSLQLVLTCIMKECQTWLQQHQEAQMSERQGAIPDAPSSQQDIAAVHAHTQLLDVIRWKNRCLRGILCTAAAEDAFPGQTAVCDSANSSNRRTASPCGVWLPQQCWQPVRQAAQQSTRDNSSCDHDHWSLLLPESQAQQQQQCRLRQDLLLQDAPTAATCHTAGETVPTLYYQNLQEPVQYSRHLQKLQQLLLHLHIEAQFAPRLLQCLQECCTHLRFNTELKQQTVHHLAASSADTSFISLEQCLALYRLVYALTAAPIKTRGLTPGCHIVQQEEVVDAAMLQWL